MLLVGEFLCSALKGLDDDDDAIVVAL